MGDVSFTAQTKFENAMRLELNQQKSLLLSRAMPRDCAGSDKKKLDNLISNQRMRTKTERNVAVIHDTTGWDGIWVAKPDAGFLATLVDNEDELQTGVDIQGGEVMNHAGAYNRHHDNEFIKGFYGDLITGKAGTTLNAFPAGNVVPVTYDGLGGVTALGMNLAKLRRARRILASNYVDMAQTFYLALGSLQVEELMADAKAASADYIEQYKVRFSADGKMLLGAHGFEFIEIELGNPMYDDTALTLDGSGHRKLPFWTADGMVKTVWEDKFFRVTMESTMHFSAQVYTRTIVGASRTDQNRCGYILCDE